MTKTWECAQCDPDGIYPCELTVVGWQKDIPSPINCVLYNDRNAVWFEKVKQKEEKKDLKLHKYELLTV